MPADKGANYKSKAPQRMEIGVQRFAVMLAVEEQSFESAAPIRRKTPPRPR